MFTYQFLTGDGREITAVSVPEDSLMMALQAAIKQGVDLSDLDLQNQSLDGLNAAGARLFRANFSMCSLVGANFTGANLTDCSFAFANLNDAVFTDAVISLDTDWVGAKLAGSVYETGPSAQNQ